MRIEPEQRIGPYRLLEPLGGGGMGVVWRAEHVESGLAVALKTVKGAREGMLLGLRREIRALARLRHPGVVRVLDEGTHQGLPWYAMQLVEGLSLRAAAELRGGLTDSWTVQRSTAPEFESVPALQEPPGSGEGEAPTAARPGSSRTTRPLEGGSSRDARPSPVPVALDTAQGPAGSPPAPLHALTPARLTAVLTLVHRLCGPLAYVHGEGIVHRDLKPENVIVTPGWQPVLVDFGLMARFADELGRESLEASGLGLGTVAYVAPEQLRRDLVDARADLYSLGCMLYELLTERPPFVGADPRHVLRQHLEAEPLPPSRLRQGIPPPLDELVLHLLAKSPRERLGHADAVAAALDKLGAPARAAAGREAPHAEVPRPRSYLYRPGFAGRGDLLERFETRLQGLWDGRPGGLMLVRGESGVGKTRLLLEVTRLAGGSGLRVLAGECVPAGAGITSPEPGAGSDSRGLGSAPLGALKRPLQAIADLCREKGRDETERLLGPRGPLLTQYEPILAELPGQEAYPQPAHLPADAARLRLLSCVTEIFVELAAPRPVLLVLDDLQWADELLLAWLELALDALDSGRARMLIVGTVRSEEAGEALHGLLDAEGVETIELGRLEQPEVSRIVGDMLAIVPPPPRLSAFLARQSEGNPFFVAEYLRAAVDEGLLWRNEQGRWRVVEMAGAADEASRPPDPRPAAATAPGRAPVAAGTEAGYEALALPGSLQELLRRRLSGLSAEALGLAQAAAVLGREVEASLLAATSGLTEDRLLDALDELLRRQVLEIRAPSAVRELPAAGARLPTLSFVHDKLREVAYEGIARGLREQLHRAAARGLELGSGRPRDEDLAALAEHWHRAGELETARGYYILAARRATARFSRDEAERLYGAYLELVDPDTAEALEARLRLVEDVLLDASLPRALAHAQSAHAAAGRLRDRAALARASTLLGLALSQAGRPDEGRALLEAALGLAREEGDLRAQCNVLRSLARLVSDQGQFEQGRALLEESLSLDRQLGDRLMEGRDLARLAIANNVYGQLEPTATKLAEALRIHREVGDRYFEGETLGNLGAHYFSCGQLELALSRQTEALGIAREMGNLYAQAWHAMSHGQVYANMGRVDESRDRYHEAIEGFTRIGHRRGLAMSLCALAILERRAGDFDAALAALAQGEEILHAIGDREHLVLCLCQRGRIALALGQEARGYLEQARETARQVDEGGGNMARPLVADLEHAIEAAEAGEGHRLFRGEFVEHLRPGLRRWLVETGQLAREEGG